MWGEETGYELIEAWGVAAEERVEAVADGDAGELLGGDVGGSENGERARTDVGVGEVEVVGEGEAEGGVAHELQPLVRPPRLGGGRRVGERLPDKPPVAEAIAQEPLHPGHRRAHLLVLLLVAEAGAHEQRKGIHFFVSFAIFFYVVIHSSE